MMTAFLMLLAAGRARAEGADASVGVGLLPGADATTTISNDSASASLVTGLGLGADVGFWPREGLRLAAAAQLQTGLETDRADGNDVTARVITLGGRLEGHRLVSPGVTLYLFGQPGYSNLSVGASSGGERESGHGVALAGGLGGRFTINPQLAAFVEVGYQWSTQRFIEDDGPDPRVDLSLVLLRGGLALDL